MDHDLESMTMRKYRLIHYDVVGGKEIAEFIPVEAVHCIMKGKWTACTIQVRRFLFFWKCIYVG